MKHFSQQMIDIELRAPHLQRWRRGVRSELRRPGISADERDRLQQRLDVSGKPKIYSFDESPAPGSLDPGPMPQPDVEIDVEGATYNSISTLPHTRLYMYARQRGLEINPGDTKAQIVRRILADIQEGGENP